MSTDYGKKVIDEVIQYESPSGLTTADPSQDGGCFRKWWLKYVGGIREPSTDAQTLGVQTHHEIDHYLTTGEVVLGRLAMSARHYIPDPNPTASSELLIQDTVHDAEGNFLGWPGPPVLALEGIRTVGHIDLYQPHGYGPDPAMDYYSDYIDFAGELCRDADYTVEVTDWKTSSDIAKWAKLGPALIKTDQMPLYAKYATVRHPDAQHVRISHVYMQTKGAARAHKSTALLNLQQIEDRWEEMGSVVRTLKDVARASRPGDVPANRYACRSFRGCMHAGTSNCPMTQTETIDQIFGITKADEIRGKKPMSSLIDEINNLKTQEAASTAAPQAPTPQVDPALADFTADWEVITGANKGFPPIFGDAAQLYAKSQGLELAAGGGYAGQGQFGTLRQLNTADVKTLANNLRGTPAPAPATQAPTGAGATPPNTPAPAPAPQARAPVAPVSDAALAEVGAHLAGNSNPAAQVVTTGPSSGDDEAVTKALACREKGSFSNMRKDDMAKAICALADAYDAKDVPISVQSDAVVVHHEVPEGYTLVIDAVASQPSDRLDDYVRKVCALLEEQTGCKDIRCSDHDTLDFGKWRGALAACVRAVPLEDGCYTIWTHDEINSVVAKTLTEGARLVFRGGVK